MICSVCGKETRYMLRDVPLHKGACPPVKGAKPEPEMGLDPALLEALERWLDARTPQTEVVEVPQEAEEPEVAPEPLPEPEVVPEAPVVLPKTPRRRR